jgi:hypothetical protein
VYQGKATHPGTRRPASASALLTGFAAAWTADEVRLDDIIDVLQDRVYGLVFLALAIPNMIPGVALLLGVPLVIVSGQMVLGWPKPRLPRFIGRKAMKTEDFRSFIAKAEPWLHRAERMLRPRAMFLFRPLGERFLGLVVLVMSVVLTLPIWGANFVPALAICLIALALVEFDGLMALLGIAAAAAGVVVASGVIYGALKVAFFLLTHAFN